MAHQELGTHLVEKVRDDLSSMSQVETEPKIAGRNITMTLAPLPENRRKRKFTAPKAVEENQEAGAVNAA
jgi:translation initiation factor IF-3